MFETLWCIDEELKQQQPRPEGWPSKPKDAGNQNLSCRWILSCGRTSVATSCKSRDKNFKRGWTCSAWDRTWPLCTNGWMGGASAALFPQELSFLELQPIIAFPLNIYKLSRCKCNAAWGNLLPNYATHKIQLVLNISQITSSFRNGKLNCDLSCWKSIATCHIVNKNICWSI